MSQEQVTPVTFESMDLSKEILQAVHAMGFQEPSTVQARTIPLMMAGTDINAIAPTGTGKTCAFGIPMLEYVQLKDSRIQEVVLAPTRELALQIGEELTNLAKYIDGVRIAVIYGGQSISKQIAALKRKPQIVIATPGRMLDHMQRGNIRGRSGRDAEHGLCQGRDKDHRGNSPGAPAGALLCHHQPGCTDDRLEIPA